MYIPLLVALALLAAIGSARAEPIKVGGSGAATKLLSVLSANLDEKRDQVALEVIPSLGSSGGLRALAEGALDVAVSGRPLTGEEAKLGMRVAVTMQTPFALVTSHAEPNGLKSDQLADIYRAPRAEWADGSPLRVILRPKSDSDTPLLGWLFPGMASAMDAARKRHDVTVAATDQDNAEAAERIPGSLAGASLAQIKTEQRRLRLIAVNGVTPSLTTLETGAYPFGKLIHVVLPATNNAMADRFVAFLRSPAGVAALRENEIRIVAEQGKP
jgi:phosphate transport system substrate-binding protein